MNISGPMYVKFELFQLQTSSSYLFKGIKFLELMMILEQAYFKTTLLESRNAFQQRQKQEYFAESSITQISRFFSRTNINNHYQNQNHGRYIHLTGLYFNIDIILWHILYQMPSMLINGCSRKEFHLLPVQQQWVGLFSGIPGPQHRWHGVQNMSKNDINIKVQSLTVKFSFY